jgi:hypothetical protein
MDEKITTASLIEQLELNQIESLAVTKDHLKELGGLESLAKLLLRNSSLINLTFYVQFYGDQQDQVEWIAKVLEGKSKPAIAEFYKFTSLSSLIFTAVEFKM